MLRIIEKLSERWWWKTRRADWVKAYWKTRDHPHRDTLIEVLKKIEFKSVLEIGCNCAPNLERIKNEFKATKLAGIDINEQSIKTGRKMLPEADLRVADATNLPFKDKSFDLILTDAILIYIKPREIRQVISEMSRVGKKAIVMVEWLSNVEDKKFGHWRRDYTKLFESTELTKINNWGGIWNSLGFIITVRL
jgi:ubiquinone/menaquinone biosynthesis C-methylase UbiE